MAEPTLLLDEMLSGALADQLPGGCDAVAVVQDSSLVSTSDEDLLAQAPNDSASW